MEHIAIDLGSKELQVFRRCSDGTIVEERRYANGRLKAQFKQWPQSRIVMETGPKRLRWRMQFEPLDTKCEWCRPHW